MRRTFLLALAVLILLLLPSTVAVAFNLYEPALQSPMLFLDENQTVYLTNLERRARGLPPLRWNRELTLSARWHSYDFVEYLMNWSSNPCGHGDSEGGNFGSRAADYGYMDFANAENVYCGYPYYSPEQAVSGWIGSDGHRNNILNPDSTEIGLGIYKRASNNWTMYTQVFGVASSPHIVIENEKPFTTTPTVSIYQGSNSGTGEMTQMGQADKLMISNNACFDGAIWQPYKAEQSWTLASGSGWRQVYSRVMDRLGRTALSNDTIYLGSSTPSDELNLDMLSQTQASVKIYGLSGMDYTKMQFSPGWIADDSNPHFAPMSGTLVRDSDAAAVGGTAAQLSRNTASSAWVWQYIGFPENIDLVAYVRLKTSANTSPNTIFSATIDPGAGTSATINIKGTDFLAANTYQEFAIPVRYFTHDDRKFMQVSFHNLSDATVWVDAVTFFTAGVPVQPTYTWNIPDGSYRGEEVWVRYANSTTSFSVYQNAITHASITLSTWELPMVAEANRLSPEYAVLVTAPCAVTPVGSEWMKTSAAAGRIRVWADTAGMAPGMYRKWMQIQYGPTTSTQLLVTLTVLPEGFYDNHLYIPSVTR